MKTHLSLPTPGKALSARTEQAVLELLPVDQKTLRRAARLMEPKNLKKVGLLAVGGTALVSLLASVGHDRVYRAAVSKELKKQLEPINRKLDALEQQNEQLLRENAELKERLMETKEIM